MCFGRKRKPRRYMQFLIHNWDDVNVVNPMAVPDPDAAMAGAGAIPVGGRDTPDGVLYRVGVTRDDLDPQELLGILAGLGFQVE
jgi:hypothetical protein